MAGGGAWSGASRQYPPVIPTKVGIQAIPTLQPRHPSPLFPVSKQPAVYILASQRNGTLYISVTSNLTKRIWKHQNGLIEGFTQKYGVHRLVYFELHSEMQEAIRREKQLKKWNRAWKIALITKENPGWQDLWLTIARCQSQNR